jgi:hypothetical protein
VAESDDGAREFREGNPAMAVLSDRRRAGYIGSYTVAELLTHGEEVIVLDSMVTGHRLAMLEDRFVRPR